MSVRSAGGGPNKQAKRSHNHSLVNEPIQEVDDEKDELADLKNKLISNTI